jgi:hypothetical protein
MVSEYVLLVVAQLYACPLMLLLDTHWVLNKVTNISVIFLSDVFVVIYWRGPSVLGGRFRFGLLSKRESMVAMRLWGTWDIKFRLYSLFYYQLRVFAWIC